MLSDTHSKYCVEMSCRPFKQALPISLRRPRGFTLIEVLVAMTILMLLVLMMTNMFSGASASANIGNDSAEVNTAGRATLNFMSMKLSQAIAGNAEPSSPSFNYWDFNLTGGSNASFYSVGDIIQSNRFYYDGSNIIYCYGANQGVLIDNVKDVKFYAYEDYDSLKMAQGAQVDPFNCHLTNGLPFCFDIAIKLISSSDKKKAEQLSGASLDNFLVRNCRWFTTRVYFQTGQGYKNKEYDDTDKTD